MEDSIVTDDPKKAQIAENNRVYWEIAVGVRIHRLPNKESKRRN